MSSRNGSDIFNEGCHLIFQTRFWGASKALTPEQLGDLPLEIVTATRSLLKNRKEIDSINHVRAEAKAFIKRITLEYPVPMVDFIRKSDIEYADEKLRYFKTLTYESLEDLVNALERRKVEYSQEFPEFYDAANYPTSAQLRANLIFKWSFRVIAPPSDEYGILSPAMYKAEVTKFQNEIKSAQDGWVSLMASEFFTRLNKIQEQCLGGDVSAATIKSTHRLLEKFNDVYKDFISHKELTKMIDDVKLYLEGTDAGMLKADDTFREMVGNKMKDITNTIQNSRDKRLTRKLVIAKQ